MSIEIDTIETADDSVQNCCPFSEVFSPFSVICQGGSNRHGGAQCLRYTTM